MTQQSPTELNPPKPHKRYSELVNLLEERGMVIPDTERAKKKLSQIGYYRLSGFWYPCRKLKTDNNGNYIFNSGIPVREEAFQENVNFNSIMDLYLFDKKLRQLMLDAIERIEIHVRSIIAHEVGREDPLAYKNNFYINPKVLADKADKEGNIKNHWKNWTDKQNKFLGESKEECILHHKNNNLEIPFWVAVETWDFGLMSTYFSNLKGACQEKICTRLEVPNKKKLAGWLNQINLLRNDCAHHKRIWNRSYSNAIGLFENEYFDNLNLDDRARKRIYGLICILWFLVKKIGPNSKWIENVADLIDSKPAIDSCPLKAIGFPDNNGFPRDKFGLPKREATVFTL